MKASRAGSFKNYVFIFFIFAFSLILFACDSTEFTYPQNTDSIALTTLRGKSRNSRYVYNGDMTYMETAVINGTDEDIKEDDTKINSQYRIRKGYMLDTGSKYKSGFITDDQKMRVLATLEGNEENETSLCISFQRASKMTNATLNGDYHINRLLWTGGNSWWGSGMSFDLSDSSAFFSGTYYMTEGNRSIYYRVSDDGTLRLDNSVDMSGMVGYNGEIFFFSNSKDERGNSYDFVVGIKKSSGMDTGSLKGNYYGCEISKNPETVFAQRSRLSFDGAGNFTYICADEPGEDEDPYEEISGSYSVADDGKITVHQGGSGSITSDGKIIVIMLEMAGDWRYIIARKIK